MNFLIIGLPNVGKTSIYNLITNSANNIIHETTGTTRDWHFASLINNENIHIYDSPGVIFKKNNTIDKRFEELLFNIDVFIYVLDYKEKNYTLDKQLLNIFRKYNKQIILIINKDDNNNQDKDLKHLGSKNYFYISCSHKIGLSDLLEYLNNYQGRNKFKKTINYTIGIYGKTNVGKSTLLNKLVGFERSIVSDKPKTTTDIVSSTYRFRGNEYSIKDTAGLIRKNKIDKDSLDFFATKKTLSIVKDIDLNIFLIDIQQGFDNQSKKIFNLIYQKSNICLFVINKIDLIKKNKKIFLKELKNDILNEFSDSKNIFILTISSFNQKDIISLKSYIHKLTLEVNKNISTSKINHWLKKVTEINTHSRIKGKEVKFKYATQISNKPFTIKIFSNFSKEIDQSYKRFLVNNFCNYFKIKSKIIKIIISKSQNPYN